MTESGLIYTLVLDTYNSYRLAMDKKPQQVLRKSLVLELNSILSGAKDLLSDTNCYKYLTLLPTEEEVTVLDAYDAFAKYMHLLEKYID